MNDINDVLAKRLRGMAVRILACIEHTVGADLDCVDDNERFTLRGGDLKIIRSEILNAAGDTTRSLGSLFDQPAIGKRTVSKEMISALGSASFSVIHLEDEDVPVFKLNADFALLRKIRDEIKAGIVYDTAYVCVGTDDIVNHLLPFLDVLALAGIKVGDGMYQTWRDSICKLYLEGLDQ